MPTINLQKDLEAWYEFDSNYFDSQRNVIQDKSGYGRHAEASGGPTVGVEGPDDFEATSFDGSDDHFDPNFSFGPGSDDMTLAALFRLTDTDGSNTIMSNHNARVPMFDLYVNTNSQVHFRTKDDSGSIANVISSTTVTDGSWYWAFGRIIDGRWQQIFVDDNGLEGEVDLDAKWSETSSGADTVHIGDEDSTTTDPFNGDMTIAGIWDRALSYTEIEYLNRLTAPRRAQL